ncbi:nuclease-related domain-containing protein [Nodosilinea nodulosa]|uniref:nuclease-related domain-containing protein n=1 Tax=Nodosilinea nodulosa TaxID=416001 RepID=UPI0002F6852A|nr:nuclease-related domain-containing protein [Nodosilinea nodulosa]
MIVKELDALPPNASKQMQAGRKAEEQMAFYLRRAFGDDPTIKVLNGLRVERQGEIAQIDHLLISNHGFVLIESKSVTTKIRVNTEGEWSRQVAPDWKGMPSPLLQVDRQAELLRALLNDHVDDFYRKLLAFQFTFTSVPFDGLVAISDTGVIQRPSGFATKQVLKADQITRRIQEMNAAYRRASSLFSLNLKDAGAEWSDKTMTKLVEFLLQRHTPQPQPISSPISAKILPSSRETRHPPQPKRATSPVAKPQSYPTPSPRPQTVPVATRGATAAIKPQPSPIPSPRPQPAAAQTAPTVSGATCRGCGGSRLAITYGKYGYYFKCADCGGNTPIKVTCANGEKAKISKQGREFYVVCSDMSEPQLFYVNPEN